jgi:hypothetical protein
MSLLQCRATRWKGRSAFTLSNGTLEVTILLVGGHIADFRRADSSINAVWEASWDTIEPDQFQNKEHAALYGEGAVGQFLSGFTGHALAIEYFGMPSPAEAGNCLPLHGEASSSRWNVVSADVNPAAAELVLSCDLPAYGMEFSRRLTLSAGAAAIRVSESVRNLTGQDTDFQWVQHLTMGEPFLASGEAVLSIPASRGKTWALGYEGKPALIDNREFTWPMAPAIGSGTLDLSKPFAADHSGFVAALQLANAQDSYLAAINQRYGLIFGYAFERARFPWIALWQENRAREYAPWNGAARALGIEFGTSPMPLGLQQAKEAGPLFETPTFLRLGARSTITTSYEIFLEHVPISARTITVIDRHHPALRLTCDTGEVIEIVK